MSEFQEVFDISQLDDYQLGHIMFVLNSPSYIDVFEPHLRKMRNSLNTLLLDPRSARKEEYPDDFLRGGIAMVDGLLTLFKKIIEETQIETITRSQQALSPEQQYEILRQEGKIKPGVEYNPDTDY